MNKYNQEYVIIDGKKLPVYKENKGWIKNERDKTTNILCNTNC